MTWWEAVLLGAVQGLFMFVPVSSTSHLVMTQHMLIATGSNLPPPESAEMILFDLVVHTGTVLSIVVVFWSSLTRFLRSTAHDLRQRLPAGGTAAPAGAAPRAETLGLRLSLLGLLTVAVTGTIGLLLGGALEAVFARPFLIAATLTATGVLLWTTDRLPPGWRGLRQIGPGTAALIGVAQAAGLAPGLSRSGTTVGAALLLRMRRRWAAQYSFLVAIPTILAATAVQGFAVWRAGEAASIGLLPLVLAFVVAALVGIVALRLVVVLLYRARLRIFAYYVWLLAAGVVLFSIAT